MRGDRDGALRLVHSLLLSAAEPATLIEDGLVPLQRRVGELWERSLIDVVEEERITAIVEELLSAIVYHIPRGDSRDRVICACPLGEWHTLPARMASELLQMHDWSVTFSGASTPSATLAAVARSRPPLAVVLSCTMATRSRRGADAIEAMHELHLPVLVGGAGFGRDDRRARAVGADGWARSMTEADRILASWSRRTPAMKAATSATPPLLSPAAAADATDEVLRHLGHRGSGQESHPRIGVTGPDITLMLDFVNAALLTADPGVVAEMLEWHRRTFAARHLPPGTLAVVVEALTGVLPPVAGALISQADPRRFAENSGGAGAAC